MKALVSNIPILSFIEAYVEIPGGLNEDQAHDAVKDAILRGEFRPKDGSSPDNYELDEATIEDGWLFDWSEQ
jgi:hypothetical protein